MAMKEVTPARVSVAAVVPCSLRRKNCSIALVIESLLNHEHKEDNRLALRRPDFTRTVYQKTDAPLSTPSWCLGVVADGVKLRPFPAFR
jgi:hypothetical protein